MLPPLIKLTVDTKRQRTSLPPCPEELFYKDGELVNRDSYRRVQGSSNWFARTPLDVIPLSPPYPSSWAELRLISGHINTAASMPAVLTELYKRREPTAPTTDGNNEMDDYGNEAAFTSVYDNEYQSQYYLQTLTKAATLVHIITNGRFWHPLEKNLQLDQGVHAFTYGLKSLKAW